MKKYSLVYNSWNQKEKIALNKVIKSNNFTMGKKVMEFEKKFSNFINRKYSVMVNSGSSANLLLISSLFYFSKKPLKIGDEVIVPGVAWSTTYAPLQQLGLKLKIVDINLVDFNIDIEKLKKAITKKTKVIFAVNLLGAPCELVKIKKLCKKKKIYLVEDNCESLGAKINKKFAGTFGILSSHSFFYSHHISTMEGGMVSTDNYELYLILKAIRAHGWTRDLPNSINKKNKNFYEQYNFLLPGYNLRPGEMHAAAGIEQLKKLKKFIKIRQKNLEWFKYYFSNEEKYLIPNSKFESSSFSFPIIIKKKYIHLRYKILNLLRKNKIDFRLIAGGSFISQPYSKYFNYTIFDSLKNSKLLHQQGFMVGNSGVDLKENIKKLHHILSNV